MTKTIRKPTNKQLFQRRERLSQQNYKLSEKMRKAQSTWDKLRAKRNELGRAINEVVCELKIRGEIE